MDGKKDVKVTTSEVTGTAAKSALKKQTPTATTPPNRFGARATGSTAAGTTIGAKTGPAKPETIPEEIKDGESSGYSEFDDDFE